MRHPELFAAALLTVAINHIAPAYCAERRVQDMPAGFQRAWLICDQQLNNVTADQRIAACNMIISLGENGNPNKTVYAGGLWGRARAYCDEQQYSKAITDFNTAINVSMGDNTLKKTNAWAMYGDRASCLVKMRKYDEAIEDLKRASASTFFNLEFFWQELRGDIAVAKGDDAEAIKYYEREFRHIRMTKA